MLPFKHRRCPKCGSKKVYAKRQSIFAEGIFRCRDCYHKAPRISESWRDTSLGDENETAARIVRDATKND